MAPPTENPTERLIFLPDFAGRDCLYRPLDANKDEIRIITVQPCHERSSAIHCFLQTTTIQDGRSTIPYDAISYFWGSTETTDNIIVHDGPPVEQPGHGFEVPVTYALTGALRQFRAKATESQKPLVLWTDAICINQRNVAERSQQVAIMRKVYEAATSVLIWLGEGDPVAEAGLVDLFGLAMCRQAGVTDRDPALDAFDYDDFDGKPDLQSLERVDAISKSYGKPGGVSRECPDVRELGADMVSWVQTFAAFLDLPYWYRGWTLQEACANDHVQLHYGLARFRVSSWKPFKDVIIDESDFSAWLAAVPLPTMFHFHSWLHAAVAASSSSDLFRYALSRIELTERRLISTTLRLDLQTIARRARRTSDPRDQVYSQIGCMVGLTLIGIKPDYTLTTEQVFTATTFAILHAGQSWAHLPFLYPSKSPFLLSWVIDFTMTYDRDVIEFQNLLVKDGFNADSNASFRLQSQESQAGSILTAGFIYDLVVTVQRCDRFSGEETCIEWFLTLARTVEDLDYFSRDDAHTTMEDFWVSFCRTLAEERVGEAKFGPQHAARCRHFYRGFFCGEHELFSDLLETFSSRIFGNVVRLQRHARRFFITRDGHLGLATRDVNVGDYVSILATGVLPFIVRKVGGQEDHRSSYILVGGCYMDGKTLNL
jgi:hypothetical protein